MNICDETVDLWINEPASDTILLPLKWHPPVAKNFITCPKCGTAQEKRPSCVQCRVIFEKIGIHSQIQPPEISLKYQHDSGLTSIMAKGFRKIIRYAMTGVIILSIALQPLIACFLVEKWSGKEIAWLNLSEAKAIIAGSLGMESWNWNNLSDSAGTVFLSPEMNPIRVELQFSHLRLPSKIPDRHFTYNLRLMDKNGVAAFGKNGIQYLTAGKTFANMLSGGDRSTELLGTLNITRGGSYKISYDKDGFNDSGIRGFMTSTALILRQNTVVVPIHFYIISAVTGIVLFLLSLAAKRRWL